MLPSPSPSPPAQDSLTRRRILRTALRLLVKHGHAWVSLRAVARGARLAPSSLYEHFADRAALLEALALAALADLAREIAGACAARGSSPERLAGAAAVYLRFAHERQHEFDLCFSRVQPPERTAPPPSSPLIPVIAEIHRGVVQGELCPPAGLDVLDMAISLWTQLHGMAVLRAAYLSQLPSFEDKARQIVAGTLAAWSRG